MKIAQVLLIFAFFAALTSTAQTGPMIGSGAVPPSPDLAAAPPELEVVLKDLRGVIDSTVFDLRALRIDRWKAENAQKQQIVHAADSLSKNLATVMPGPAGDLGANPRSVIRSFRLYQNLNLVYEFLNDIADTAGSFGRPEEHSALAADAASVDRVRRSLAKYTEHAAGTLEDDLRESRAREAVLEARLSSYMQSGPPRKVVVEDAPQSKKPKKAARKVPPVTMP